VKIFDKPSLVSFDGNRQNNFTLIRIVFAWLVLYGHSYAIQKVAGIRDPLNHLFQGSVWVGELAVNGFFAISGFLVAASIINRGWFDYLVSRMLRIYPALIVCVLSSVFILSPLLTNTDVIEYFTNFKTYTYLRNTLAFIPMQWTLPGVFEENARGAINGSLWTLTVEVRCYLLLAIVGFFGILRHKVIANFFLLSLLLFGYSYFPEMPLLGHNSKWSRPSLYFLIGVFFYINRSSVLLDGKLALFALAIAVSSFGKEWFHYVFPLSFVYLIFYAAYATKYIPVDEKIGDLSYGIYIYAWPIQQVIAHSTPNGNPYLNTVLSSIVVIILAYFSWHKIEKPILNRKHNVLSSTRNKLRPLREIYTKRKFNKRVN
jgi:peptidoglycan/LPS O-acetylase OafA/YrhL